MLLKVGTVFSRDGDRKELLSFDNKYVASWWFDIDHILLMLRIASFELNKYSKIPNLSNVWLEN